MIGDVGRTGGTYGSLADPGLCGARFAVRASLDLEGHFVAHSGVGGSPRERLDVQKQVGGAVPQHETEPAVGVPGFDDACLSHGLAHAPDGNRGDAVEGSADEIHSTRLAAGPRREHRPALGMHGSGARPVAEPTVAAISLQDSCHELSDVETLLSNLS